MSRYIDHFLHLVDTIRDSELKLLMNTIEAAGTESPEVKYVAQSPRFLIVTGMTRRDNAIEITG